MTPLKDDFPNPSASPRFKWRLDECDRLLGLRDLFNTKRRIWDIIVISTQETFRALKPKDMVLDYVNPTESSR